MKTKILVENFGNNVRLSLEHNQNETAYNQFANLAWLCHENTVRHDCESFIVSREKLADCIKAFRASNIAQARRGKGLWKEQPFTFKVVEQHATKGLVLNAHAQGYYQDTQEEIETRQLASLTENIIDKPLVGITFNNLSVQD